MVPAHSGGSQQSGAGRGGCPVCPSPIIRVGAPSSCPLSPPRAMGKGAALGGDPHEWPNGDSPEAKRLKVPPGGWGRGYGGEGEVPPMVAPSGVGGAGIPVGGGSAPSWMGVQPHHGWGPSTLTGGGPAPTCPAGGGGGGGAPGPCGLSPVDPAPPGCRRHPGATHHGLDPTPGRVRHRLCGHQRPWARWGGTGRGMQAWWGRWGAVGPGRVGSGGILGLGKMDKPWPRGPTMGVN